MALTFTPNIGLAKPTETELAQDWALTPKLAEDNNLIVAAKSDIVLNSYGPTLIGPTTNPSVGAGQILGEYIDFQGFIFGSFNIAFLDPGIGVGSGVGGYGISLPVLADNSFHTVGNALNNALGSNSCIGEGYFTDDSVVANSGTVALDIVRVGGVDYARMMTEAYAGKTVIWIGPTFAMATDDKFTGSFWYKKA
jgi:hypothetical protein